MTSIVNEWLPIDENTPRDGTKILLYATVHNMAIPTNERVVGSYCRSWWSGDRILSNVTHWQHLPNPPTTEALKESI